MRMSELEARGPRPQRKLPSANAGAIDWPAAIHADAGSLRHSNPRRPSTDSRSDTDAGCTGADSWRDADTGCSGISRPHDASARYAGGPAIDLGLGRRGDERQEQNCESEPVLHNDLY